MEAARAVSAVGSYHHRVIKDAPLLVHGGRHSGDSRMARVTGRGSEAGQGLGEYLLILALIALVALSALLFLGGGMDTILSTIGKSH
jgi:Flp pilus assembly pilin Flp